MIESIVVPEMGGKLHGYVGSSFACVVSTETCQLNVLPLVKERAFGGFNADCGWSGDFLQETCMLVATCLPLAGHKTQESTRLVLIRNEAHLVWRFRSRWDVTLCFWVGRGVQTAVPNNIRASSLQWKRGNEKCFVGTWGGGWAAEGCEAGIWGQWKNCREAILFLNYEVMEGSEEGFSSLL